MARRKCCRCLSVSLRCACLLPLFPSRKVHDIQFEIVWLSRIPLPKTTLERSTSRSIFPRFLSAACRGCCYDRNKIFPKIKRCILKFNKGFKKNILLRSTHHQPTNHPPPSTSTLHIPITHHHRRQHRETSESTRRRENERPRFADTQDTPNEASGGNIIYIYIYNILGQLSRTHTHTHTHTHIVRR